MASTNNIATCSACGKESDSLKSCVACKLVKYCNRSCQSRAWPSVSRVYLCTLIYSLYCTFIFIIRIITHTYATRSFMHPPQSTKKSVSNVQQKYMMNLCSKNLLLKFVQCAYFPLKRVQVLSIHVVERAFAMGACMLWVRVMDK